MRIFLLGAGSAAMMWISVVGCTGSTAGDEITALVDKFCNDIAGPYCEADWTCCLRPGAHFGENVNDCKQRFASPTNESILEFCQGPGYGARSDLEASLRAGTTIFDQAQLDACLALLRSMAAGGTACVEPPGYVVTRMCLSAFRGQIPPGEPCPWPDKLFSDSVTQCKDGRCEANKCVPFLKIGDTCAPLKGNWAEPANTICNYAHNETCKAPLADGGTGDSGTCAPAGDIGDPCNFGRDSECKGWNCDATGKCGLPDPSGIACYATP